MFITQNSSTCHHLYVFLRIIRTTREGSIADNLHPGSTIANYAMVKHYTQKGGNQNMADTEARGTSRRKAARHDSRL